MIQNIRNAEEVKEVAAVRCADLLHTISADQWSRLHPFCNAPTPSEPYMRSHG